MSVNHVVTTRRTTIRIVRRHDVEIGARVVIYWNGTIAPNGDGIPGGVAPVDYADPLAAEPMWRSGQLSLFGGRFGIGGFAESGADPDQSMGFGMGPFGVGAFGVGGGRFHWRPNPQLRDGEYEFAIRLRDALGNEQQADTASIRIEVSAIPRPATNTVLEGFDQPSGILTVGFTQSPEFQPTS